MDLSESVQYKMQYPQLYIYKGRLISSRPKVLQLQFLVFHFIFQCSLPQEKYTSHIVNKCLYNSEKIFFRFLHKMAFYGRSYLIVLCKSSTSNSFLNQKQGKSLIFDQQLLFYIRNREKVIGNRFGLYLGQMVSFCKSGSSYGIPCKKQHIAR